MKKRNFIAVLTIFLIALPSGAGLLFGGASGKTDFFVQGLRCEYLSNPLGIDIQKPRLGWLLNPAANVRGQSAYRVLVASAPEILRKDRGDLWDSGRVTSEQSTWVEYGGKKLDSGQQVYWKVRVWSDAGKASPWSAQATWSMGLLQPSDWHSKWIGERRPDGIAEGTPLPFPWLRRTFTLTRKPKRAVAYVNPLGYYELYINGRKVDDHVLSPAVSDYSKRNLYVTHEIAEYLVKGKNVAALWLGRGWYVKGHPGVIHDGPLVRAQLEISLGDGSTTRVVTDETWKVRESPLTPLGRGTAFGDYGGERTDAALELPGWNTVNLDDSAWQTAAVFEPPQVLTAAQMVEPNRLMETIQAARVEAYPPGGWIIDMGRNFTGWLEIKLPPIAKGSTVKLEYSDQMERDKPAPGAAAGRAGGGPVGSGVVAGQNAPGARGPGVAALPGSAPPAGATAGRGTAAAGAAAGAGRGGRGGNQTVFPNTFNQRDEVVGNGVALTFRSRFNYHAFRYVRVIGVETAPEVSSATGYLIRTAYDRAGEFASSNELLNQIYQLVTRTYEALTLGGYVVDCPTRERLGYGGDAGTSMETGMFNFSTGGLYNRWLANWRDSQVASGSLPHTAPNYPNQGGGGPMWGGFVVTLPWRMYLQYGDKGVLESNYPMIQKWLDYLDSETQDNLLLTHTSHAISDNWNFLGDWLTPKGSFRGNTPPAQQINSVHYVYQLQLASRIANVLGKAADASAYDARAAAVSKAVHQRFYNAGDYSYTNGDSVQEAFPLLTGIVPPELRKGVMEKLENTIRVQNNGHLDTGMHGTYFLIKYLMETDRNDLIYEMTSQKDYPGWGYMLANGATTSWESWTGQSHIHDTLISIGAWFTEGVAGIRSDGKSPGFKHFIIKPAVVGDLTFANARYRSIHGDIVSDWRIDNGTFKLSVTVPPGTTTTVFVPGEGVVRTQARRSPSAGEGSDRAFEVAAGTHSFETALRNPNIEIVESIPVETSLDNPEIRNTREVWLEMIGRARATLDLEQFYISDGPGKPLASVLATVNSAADRGVKVRILLDARMYATYPEIADTLAKRSNIEVRRIDFGAIADGIQHSKYFIVDGKEIFVGSQNFDWRALEHIHELGLRIVDRQIAAAYEDVFDLDWQIAALKPEAIKTFAVPMKSYQVPIHVETAAGDSAVLFPTFSPLNFIPDSTLWDERAMVGLIDGAKKSLTLQFLSYSLDDRQGGRYAAIDDAIRRAASRGVRVRLIVSDWQKGTDAVPALKDLAGTPNIEVAFTEIPDWSGGYIPYARVEHCKYIVADETKFWLGTSNCEKGYYYRSRNLGIVCTSPSLAGAFSKIFLKSWNSSYKQLITPTGEYAPREHGVKK